MNKPPQNPHRCSDQHCILLLPGAPKGMGTNGGCRCLRNCDSHETKVRVKQGIRWLAERAAKAPVEEVLTPLPEPHFELIEGPLSYARLQCGGCLSWKPCPVAQQNTGWCLSAQEVLAKRLEDDGTNCPCFQKKDQP